jgi:hypothetical protein
MSIGRSGQVTASDVVHYRQFDDELLVLDLGTGSYFALNPVGTKMWNALVSGKSPAEVAADLASDYEADSEVLLRDCIALADDLIDRGLLKRTQ